VPRFVCQSATCRCEVEIAFLPGNEAGQISNLQCLCGAELKKVYSEPAFRELSEAEALLLLGDDELQAIRKLGGQ